MGQTCTSCCTLIESNDETSILMRPYVKKHFDSKHNLDILIRVQACVRAFLARKRCAKLRQNLIFQGRPSQYSATASGFNYNYHSEAVSAVIAHLGPFDYNNHAASEEMLQLSGFQCERRDE